MSTDFYDLELQELNEAQGEIEAIWYNFVRYHSKIRMTPAMACGICDTRMDFEDLVKIVEDWELEQMRNKEASSPS